MKYLAQELNTMTPARLKPRLLNSESNVLTIRPTEPITTRYLMGYLFFLLYCLPKENMGFQQGGGLGRYGQGRSDIIEASQQRGRRGLGFRVEGFDDKDFTWDEEEEACTVFNVTRRYTQRESY